MELNGNLGVQSDREQLWDAIYNTEAWKKAIPDAEKFEKIDENIYEMVVKVDMAVFKGSQTMKIIFNNPAPPVSNEFTIENGLIKKAAGSFNIMHPDEAPLEDGAAMPEGTRSVLGYNLSLDAGNPLFNAALEGFKPKIKQGLEEILLRLDTHARPS